MKEEGRQRKRRVRKRINNEEYPEVEYKDVNGDIVATERKQHQFSCYYHLLCVCVCVCM